MTVAEVPAPVEGAQPAPLSERANNGPALPAIHFPTLAVATGVCVFFYGLTVANQNAIESRIAAVADRIDGIPTKAELGTEIEQVAEIQRSTWEANATRVEASATTMEATVANVQTQLNALNAHNTQINTMLNDRINTLDVRIANLGTDFSGAIIEYFQTGRAGQVDGGVDGQGGPDEAEQAYRDYAIRLMVRDENMNVGDAIRFVDRAFLNLRGPEAQRLAGAATAARSRNRGVVSD